MDGRSKSFQFIMLLSVFVVATCGLIYELVAGTLASYLLGDSVTQFSTIIGTYLFSMGIGSYWSKFFKGNLIRWFIQIEILVGLVGGFSSTILFLLFEQIVYFRLVLYGLVGITGILVGLEIPLLMRILKDRLEFSDLVSKIFTFDYIGALLASIIFPLLLIPALGIMKTSLFFGLINVIVALVIAFKLKGEVNGIRWIIPQGIITTLLLIMAFIFSERLLKMTESLTYQDKIIYAKSSPYQRVVVTKDGRDLRLYLNGNLQFSSLDEYRYHEALVHPVMSMVPGARNVLILGGGDGLAAREVLKYASVETITLVDLDPAVTRLFSSNTLLTKLNESSLLSKRLTILNQDAFVWIKDQQKKFDVVIIDFPDPSNYSLGKLYTVAFYKKLWDAMAPDGKAVIQATSPYFARRSYWIVDETLHETGFNTLPYHCYIPTFGEWGFVVASSLPIDTANINFEDQHLRFISKETFHQLTYFPPDMSKLTTPYNTLNNQVLVHAFEKEWSTYTP